MKSAIFALAALLFLPPGASAQSSSDKSASDKSSTPKPSNASSQQTPPDPFAGAPAAKPSDVDSVDHILAALYDVISGPAGPRDWNRFRSLFIPTAHLTSTGKAPDGSIRVRPNSVDDYANGAGSYFLKNGFFESSIVNRIESYGQVTQVFSSYESRHNAGEAPFARGINSIQMLNDGKRWWIVSILWDSERPDNPLPRDFASKP